jgi:hypothetical protein
VLTLVELGKTKNPYLSATEGVRFGIGYAGWRGKSLLKRLSGTPYQIHGPCERGEAAPEVTPPQPTSSPDAE